MSAALAPHWWWLVAAVLLAGAEIVLPGFFLIWLAAAALGTGVIVAVTGLSFAPQLIVFALLATTTVLAGRRWSNRGQQDSEDPALNRPGERLLGETVVVSEAIIAGHGRVALGDGSWAATGPDLPAGARARVIAVYGARLMVEPVALPADGDTGSSPSRRTEKPEGL